MKRRIINLWLRYWPFSGPIKSYFLYQKYISQVRYKGDGITIKNSISVARPNGMILGHNVKFEGRNKIDATAGILISDNVTIAKNVSINTINENGTYDPVIVGSNNIITTDIGPGTIIPNRDMIDSLLDYKGQMVFVVSTGRSGSKAIAQLISQHKDAQCYHDAYPHFYKYANDLLYNNTSDEVTAEKLKSFYSCVSYKYSDVIGLSDQKIAPIISILKSIFPDSKFIWVIRNAQDFVNSSYPRGWFANEEFDLERNDNEFLEKKANPSLFDAKHRTNGFLVGEYTQEQWNEITAFERNCWYWSYWNNLIEEQLLQFDDQDWMMVKLNELNEKSSEIQKFIGIAPKESSVDKVNKASYVKPTRKSWTGEMNSIYNKHCKKLMNRLFSVSESN